MLPALGISLLSIAPALPAYGLKKTILLFLRMKKMRHLLMRLTRHLCIPHTIPEEQEHIQDQTQRAQHGQSRKGHTQMSKEQRA